MSWLLVAAAIVVTFLVFTWLIKVVKATVTTALTIAAIVLILQLVFGIGPDQLWAQINQITQMIWQTVVGR